MKPATVIGLRLARRVSGEPYLRGVVPAEFLIPAGAQVQLRRLRPDGAEGATHAIVFTQPDGNVTERQIEQANRDAEWFRAEVRP